MSTTRSSVSSTQVVPTTSAATTTEHKTAMDSLSSALASFRNKILSSPNPTSKSRYKPSSLSSSIRRISITPLPFSVPILKMPVPRKRKSNRTFVNPLRMNPIEVVEPVVRHQSEAGNSKDCTPSFTEAAGSRDWEDTEESRLLSALYAKREAGFGDELAEKARHIYEPPRIQAWIQYQAPWYRSPDEDDAFVSWTPRTRSQASSWVSPMGGREMGNGNVWRAEEEAMMMVQPLRLGMKFETGERSPSNYSGSAPGTPVLSSSHLKKTRSFSTTSNASLNPWVGDERKEFARGMEGVVRDFENTVISIEVFASLDVEALIEEPGWEFEDHDAARGWTYMDLRPHQPSRVCWCWTCCVERERERGVERHESGRWCWCESCNRFCEKKGEGRGMKDTEWYTSLIQRIRQQERDAIKGEEDSWINDDEDVETEQVVVDAGVESQVDDKLCYGKCDGLIETSKKKLRIGSLSPPLPLKRTCRQCGRGRASRSN